MARAAPNFRRAVARARLVLEAAQIVVLPITDDIARAAVSAFARYGKGRGHPARLNLADCLSYAAATSLRMPLLYKGDDFAQTDVDAAIGH